MGLSENFPAGQAPHVDDLAVEYCPMLQLVQDPRPAREDDHAGHTLHSALPVGAYIPSVHATQVAADVAPVVLDAVPLAHIVQTVALAAAHCPEGHSSQVNEDRSLVNFL